MIALDTSAVFALAWKEPESERFSQAIASHQCVIGAPTLLECHFVLRPSRNPAIYETFQEIVSRPQIKVEPFTRDLYELAAAAFDRYGKGRGHPAQLNFGDCMAYAVAKAHGVPLLYKGDDFAQTDIASAA